MNLRSEVSKDLVRRGFRRNGRTHILFIKDDVSIGVDTGPLGKRGDIAPYVGLRHDRVERLLTQLLQVPEDEYSWTVGANVGYVLGEGYLRWDPPVTPEDVIRSIDAALARLNHFLTLSSLTRLWEEIPGTRDPSWRYRQIIVLYLQGERASAASALRDAQIEFCKDENEICEQFRAFERRVEPMISNTFKAKLRHLRDV